MINSALMAGCNNRKWIERIQAESSACVSCWSVGNSYSWKVKYMCYKEFMHNDKILKINYNDQIWCCNVEGNSLHACKTCGGTICQRIASSWWMGLTDKRTFPPRVLELENPRSLKGVRSLEQHHPPKGWRARLTVKSGALHNKWCIVISDTTYRREL